MKECTKGLCFRVRVPLVTEQTPSDPEDKISWSRMDLFKDLFVRSVMIGLEGTGKFLVNNVHPVLQGYRNIKFVREVKDNGGLDVDEELGKSNMEQLNKYINLRVLKNDVTVEYDQASIQEITNAINRRGGSDALVVTKYVTYNDVDAILNDLRRDRGAGDRNDNPDNNRRTLLPGIGAKTYVLYDNILTMTGEDENRPHIREIPKELFIDQEEDKKCRQIIVIITGLIRYCQTNFEGNQVYEEYFSIKFNEDDPDNSKLYIAAPYTENIILVQGVANFIDSDDPNKNNNSNDNNNKGWSQLFSPKDGSTKSFINIGDDDYDDDDDDGQGYSDDESSNEDNDVCCDLTASLHETEGHDHLRDNDVEDEVRDSGTSLIHNNTTTTAGAAAGLGRLVQTDNTELNEAYNQIRVLREDNNVVIQRSNEACNEISELREVVAHLQAENTGLRRAHSGNNFFHFC